MFTEIKKLFIKSNSLNGLAASILLIGLIISVYRLSDLETAQWPVHIKEEHWIRRSLDPIENPDPNSIIQPSRLKPLRVVATKSGTKAYVTLSGKEIMPGSEVAVIDIEKGQESGRIKVGSGPSGIALHPSGQWAFVANRFSNFLSVIDLKSDSVTREIAVPFYCEEILFSHDGNTAYVSNFSKNQILLIDLEIRAGSIFGQLRNIGFKPSQFVGISKIQKGKEQINSIDFSTPSINSIIRGSCGTVNCHLYEIGNFYAGPDSEKTYKSVLAHVFPGDTVNSPLLKSVISKQEEGWADRLDGRHHAGGIVFEELKDNTDYRILKNWIAELKVGPGIEVGDKPRDMVLSPDGQTLFVANTGSLDISVVDLKKLKESRRIYSRSPVNDLVWVNDRMVAATLGVGSGHPKNHHAGRESRDRNNPETEFTLFRDLKTGRPLPLDQQKPLGPYDDIDGTAQEKFRDITNDIVVFKPQVNSIAAYEANQEFTRYTSDSFESLMGDKKGDVSPDLMQVVGAFPEQMVVYNNHLYVTMSGTFQVQEWEINFVADPANLLIPKRVFNTGYKPCGIAVAGHSLIVANQLDETLTIISLNNGGQRSIALKSTRPPFPSTDFERGEFFVQTSIFSVDQDQSCVHCHYRDASDGKRWSVSQVMGQSRDGAERTGGSREIPDIRALFHKVPFFIEGTLSMDEALTMMMEHNPLVDFQNNTPAGDFSKLFADQQKKSSQSKSADAIVVATGKKWNNTDVDLADLVERREEFFKRQSQKFFGKAFSFREIQKFIGDYQGGEPRLLPNPNDPTDLMVSHGKGLFENPLVGCVNCHPAPSFTDKVHVYNQNKSFPPLVTPTARDNIHTLISADRIDYLDGYKRDWDPNDTGRIEEKEGFYAAPSLLGIWARPPRFLHHGGAMSLREVLCAPGHPALRPLPSTRVIPERPGRWEIGLNELNGVPDTHGVTSHLSVWDIECLVEYINSIN
ncbi:MAG: YncE family protein [Reichenbachiella sp.]